MITRWAAALTCDRCKAKSDPDMDGWLTGQRFITPSGVVWNELCPDCQSLSYRELTQHVQQ